MKNIIKTALLCFTAVTALYALGVYLSGTPVYRLM